MSTGSRCAPILPVDTPLAEGGPLAVERDEERPFGLLEDSLVVDIALPREALSWPWGLVSVLSVAVALHNSTGRGL